MRSQPRAQRQPSSLWRTLRGRLTLTLVAFSILPAIIIGGVALVLEQSVTTSRSVNQLEAVAELKEQQVAQWLRGAQLVLTTAVSGLEESRLLAFNGLPSSYQVAQRGEWNAGLAKIIEGQSKITDTTSGVLFNEIFVYNKAGVITAASDSIQVGKTVARQEYFQNSVQNAAYIQPPYFDVQRGRLTMFVTRALVQDGVIQAVIAARLETDTLSQIMQGRIGLGETGETYLVSVDSNYLLTPSRYEGYAVLRTYNTEGVTRAFARQNGTGFYDNYQNPPVPVIGVYRWSPELNAALLSEISQAEVQVLFRQTAIATLGVVALTMLIASLIGFIVARSISRPIAVFAPLALQIASGDLSRRVKVRDFAEVAVLSDAFNTMTDQLDATIKQLNTRITEVNTANSALEIATQQAQEATRLKSEFISTMSHELRTPLNAISGFTGIMLQGMAGEIDQEAQHMLERIDSNSVRLLRLINNILDLTRIEAGRVELSSEPITLRESASSWETQLSNLAQEKGLAFVVNIDPGLPTMVLGDPDRIDQIAVNLLSNAIKFTEKGSVTLSLRADGGRWMMEVADTGIGIPPHALGYIFDEFRQVDGSSTRAYGGSGLGLAIARNLARMMGGNITVNSTMGEGSVFTASFPIAASTRTRPLTDVNEQVKVATRE